MMRAMNSGLRLFLGMLLAAACAGGTGAQTVTNVRAAQRAGTKLVDVYYDLSGGSGPSTVAVAVSDNGGASFNVPASSLSGAVGGGVNAGLNKHVVWNAGADWNGQFSQAVRFRITASGTPTAPDGFALIPAGSFTMGRTSGDTDSNAPPVSVYVSAFYMAKYEVTKALWDEVRTWGASNGYNDLPIGGGKAANHPVQLINWRDTIKWCNAFSEKDGLTPCYLVSGLIYREGDSDTGDTNRPVCNWSANGYRLPTEAEWEKAARGGQGGWRFPWGNTINHSHANYRANSNDSTYDTSGYSSYTFHPSYNDGTFPYTSPVGSFASNGYGLHDLAGNVSEFCWDNYSTTYYTDGVSDPRGPVLGSNARSARGGSWNGPASGSRVAVRSAITLGSTSSHRGFRLARNSIQ